ncbi:hypothetical protein BWZ20_04065 [Winogradskyella sp. J14-2]|uniref:hypothetical protein n=1 Tax=Winogradskyella sp. J14-2 TaxID=1936080 RepID=UPI0009727601|nr:hypothetical protein [Winogradskyella sp. J14-2]APY07521.1 hypothetical protein BWZ20_04065 [Winogradskyella sp. J14-2]
MKLLHYILILFNIYFSFAQDSVTTKTSISWKKEIKLKWEDFKGIPDTNILAYAQTSYKIEIFPTEVNVDADNNIQGFEKLYVVANFYSNHSWVYKESDYLLKHEQLHFDIAGLYALKINDEFKKLIAKKIANFDTYFEVYQNLWKECLETQKQYDLETQHGQLVEENDKWIKTINRLIINLL